MRLTHLQILLAALLSLSAGATSAAEFTTGVSYAVRASGAPDKVGQTSHTAATPGVPLGVDVTNGAQNAGGTSQAAFDGWGRAGDGHLQAYTHATGSVQSQAPMFNTYASGDLTAALTDSFVIGCGGCAAGSIGTMNFRIYFGGTTLRDGHVDPLTESSIYVADTHWGATFSIRADGVPNPIPDPGGDPSPPNPGVSTLQYSRTDLLRNGSTGVIESPHVSPGWQDLSIQFVFGEAIRLEMSLTAGVLNAVNSGEGRGTFSGDSTTTVDLTHSMYWDGISAVWDANGQQVAAFRALNANGVDFAASLAPVPEPGTWALVATGLALLGLLTRRGPASRQEHPQEHQQEHRQGPRQGQGWPARHRRLRASMLAGSMLAALTGGAQAQTFATSYSYELSAAGAPDRSAQEGGFVPPGAVRGFSDAIGFSDAALSSTARIDGWGAARYGSLQSYVRGSTSLSAQGANQSTYVRAEMTSSLTDSFVIQCGGCAAGTIGSMSFRVYFDAATARDSALGQPVTDAGGNLADTNWSTSFQIRADGVPDPTPPDVPGPPNPGQRSFEYYRLDTLHNGVPGVEESPRVSAGLQELSIDFVFGEAIHLDMSLRAAVLGGVYTGDNTGSFSGSGAMTTDATHSMYWDGITGVRDADGQLVSAFTALNAVGIDYARSLAVVPEPGTWALMLAGLAALGALARRRVRALRTATVGTVGTVAASARAVAPALLAAALLPALAASPALAATAPAPAWAGYGETLTAYDPSLNERDHFAGDDRIGGTSSFTFHTGYSTALTRTRLDAEGVSQVDYGQLRTRAAVSGSLDTINDFGRQTIANLFAGGSIHDEFVIACAGCADGATGTFTARVHVDGTISIAGAFTAPSPTSTMTQGASWNFNAALTAQGVDAAVGVDRVSGTRSVSLTTGRPPFSEDVGDPLGWHTLTVSFVFGQPIALDLGLGVQAYHFLSTDDGSGATGWSAVGTDFSHSLTWEGITGLSDASGRAITAFSALNSAGVDYAGSLAATVPEPGAWALMTVGLVVLLGIGKRRHLQALQRR